MGCSKRLVIPLSLMLIGFLFTSTTDLIAESSASSSIPLPALYFTLYKYSWNGTGAPGFVELVCNPPYQSKYLMFWDAGAGNNQVRDKRVEATGPLPPGKYYVHEEQPLPSHPDIIGYRLEPFSTKQLLGRTGGFFIHEYQTNQYESAGCIVLNQDNGLNTYNHFNETLHAVPGAIELINQGKMVLVVRYPLQRAVDKQRFDIIKNPDSQLIAMQTGTTDFLPDIIRPGDIEKLDSDGFKITAAPGFHIGHIGINIRPNRDYLIPPYNCNPDAASILSDVNFRHALFHCYGESAIQPIYDWTVIPIHGLVPPSLGEWMNPDVPTHPYNPGDPFTSPPGEHSSCGILKAAGYTFIDADSSGTVTSPDYWRTPEDYLLPRMRLWTPTYEVAPTSAEHGARFVASLASVGLAATAENGYAGIEHEPREFSPYMDDVKIGDFDMYMVFWSLGRFPDYLYDMCHSSQDAGSFPGRYNYPGINDLVVDYLVETVKTSLNHTEKLAAAWELQERLYDPSLIGADAFALAYMPLYSRIYFNAANPHLRGIVNSPGFGSDNMWTWLNIRWEPGFERIEDGKTTVIHNLADEPELLNPLSASTIYAWTIMRPTMDSLIAVNPYTHEDTPWLADNWTIEETPTGMNITFDLAVGIMWQDGNPYFASDAEFNWLFLRDNEIPRYASMWKYIDDVDVINPYTVTVVLNTTSQFLLYDLAETAAMLPPCVWSIWDGKPLPDILAWDPSANTTTPTDAGPWFGTPQGPSTQLYGTGPYMFEYYDSTSLIAELSAFHNYCNPCVNGLDVMFHEIGDISWDGYIDVWDLSTLGVSYGCFEWLPCYNVDADLNLDGVCDGRDLALITWHWGEQREYPEPYED